MSSHVKADHRLVQPRPEHYVKNAEGNDVLVGPYTTTQRRKYFSVQISMYMTRHPNATNLQAKKATFQKWRNLVFSTIGDEWIPVTDPKTAKDKIKVFNKEVPSE